MPVELVQMLDTICERRAMSRSQFFRTATLAAHEEEQEKDRIQKQEAREALKMRLLQE